MKRNGVSFVVDTITKTFHRNLSIAHFVHPHRFQVSTIPSPTVSYLNQAR
jgi:hypothetical protein